MDSENNNRQNPSTGDDSVESKVYEIIADILSVNNDEDIDSSDINSDMSLYDLGLDSLDAVSLIMSIESEFDITISDEAADEAAEKITTVGDIISFVRNCI